MKQKFNQAHFRNDFLAYVISKRNPISFLSLFLINKLLTFTTKKKKHGQPHGNFNYETFTRVEKRFSFIDNLN